MAYDPSAPTPKTAEQIQLQVVALNQRDSYFQQLHTQGWELIGNPIQFPGSSNPNMLRYWAKEYAVTINGEMVIEVNDPSFSTDPSNTLVYFVWRRRSAYTGAPAGTEQQAVSSHPGYQDAATSSAMENIPSGPLTAAYPNPIQFLEQQLWRLSTLLADPTPRFNFQDTGELLHPFVTIRTNAYEHLGGRKMDLFLLKDGIHDYKIIGNETHGETGGRLTPFRDELFSFKTLGKASYMILDEFRALDQTQQNQIIAAVQVFMQNY